MVSKSNNHKASPSVFRSRNCHPNDYRHKLYQKLNECTLDEAAISSLIDQHPKVLRVKYQFPHPHLSHEKKKKLTVHPLTKICCMKPSLALVEHVYSLYPEAIEESDESSRFALHYACRLLASREVVEFLMDKYPEAINERGRDGAYPLHLACGSFQPLEIIQSLVDHGNDDVLRATSDYEGWTPLHFAARHKAASGVIPFLLLKYQGAATIRGKEEKLPLHLACFSRKALQDVASIVAANPDAVECPTNHRASSLLPLHIACQRQCSIGVVQYLVECYPRGVIAKSKVDQMTAIEYAMQEGSSGVVVGFLQQASKRVEELEKLSNEERNERIDEILESVHRKISKESRGTYYDDNAQAPAAFVPTHDVELEARLDNDETNKDDSGAHLDSTADDDDALEEGAATAEQSFSTQRPCRTAPMPPIPTVTAPGAVRVRGFDAEDDINDDDDSISDMSAGTMPLSSNQTVATKTPIASEVAPRVAEMEAELQELRRRLDGSGEVVEATEVMTSIENRNQRARAACCIVS